MAAVSNKEFHCDYCNRSNNSLQQFEQHKTGKAHLRNANSALTDDSRKRKLSPPNGFRDSYQQSAFASQPKVNYCVLCKLQTTSPKQLEAHFKGGKHIQTVKSCAQQIPFHGHIGQPSSPDEGMSGPKKAKYQELCPTCNVLLNSPATAELHYQSPKHLKKLSNAQSATAPTNHTPEHRVPMAPPVPHHPTYCDICNKSFNSDKQLTAHLEGSKHKNTLEKQGAARPQEGIPPMDPVQPNGYRNSTMLHYAD